MCKKCRDAFAHWDKLPLEHSPEWDAARDAWCDATDNCEDNPAPVKAVTVKVAAVRESPKVKTLFDFAEAAP